MNRKSLFCSVSSIANSACCAFIRGYQICISPLHPACCRFYPSCSNYALEAFKKYGVRKGFFLSARRILRCNPYFSGGYDPVP